MKSTTCKGQNGQYLEEYLSQLSARIGAEDIKKAYGHDLIPAQCSKCGYWHLTPAQSRRQCFQCTDSALFYKDLYSTSAEAQQTADWLRKEKRVQLYVYKCPHSNGWHLTKTSPGMNTRRK